MAENHSGSPVVFRRALAVVAALALLTSAARVALAEPSTKQKLEDAKAEFEQLKGEIESQQRVVSTLLLEAQRIAERKEAAYGEWQQITAELQDTRAALTDAQVQYQGLRDDLEQRARDAYISGPASGLEFLLGASSIADLSARMEYVNALSQEDADLATKVQNVRNTLAARKDEQRQLQERAARALQKVQAAEAALKAKLAEQQAALDDLNSKMARAEELVKKLEKQYQQELAALTGLDFHAGAILKVCPVGQPHAVYDGFGAPRFAGGYHPHAGNDILAPQGTPIYATFDGFAQAGYNILGGNSVDVYGDLGYTYNAHLVEPGFTGNVSAGDVIGYVGATGDTSTPHDHFEWHPNVIPSNWPSSPYGYSVIGDAVNPFPLLSAVC
jgi:murein DD-endopeptidase MepM/ murein hydrolase activator NlpD